MDSRNIIEEPQVLESGWLEKMLELQKELIDGYVKIEGLPQYPLDVDLRSSQVILKDMTARVVEELSEAFESLEEVVSIYRDESADADPDLVKEKLQNYNEELADVIHFMLELAMYAGCSTKIVMPSHEDSIQVENTNFNYNNEHRYTLIDAKDKDKTCPLYKGGDMFFNDQPLSLVTDIATKYSWRITHLLNLSRNCLKNKPWKQDEVMTDIPKYWKYLGMAVSCMFQYMHVMGLSNQDIYYIYFKKNKINIFRQQSKY